MTHGPEPDGSITRLLRAWRAGDDEALGSVMPLLYDELRRLARAYLRSEGDSVLQPTAVVHEFYLRSTGLRHIDWQSRGQFLAAAAKVMRNLLVDEDRRKAAAKRGGGAVVAVDESAAETPPFDVLGVHLALDRMSGQYPRHAEVVELMFFGGLSAAEASEALTACGRPASPRTVERDWQFARGWLFRELKAS